MKEILCSIHNYTKFSGNELSFYSLAQAGLDCGMDAIITTDRNIYPEGHSQFYYRSGRRLLVICAEELFDPYMATDSERYLSLGIEKEQHNRKIHTPQSEIRILTEGITANNKYRHFEIFNAQSVLIDGINSSQKKIRRIIDTWDMLLKSGLHYVGTAGTCNSPEMKPYSYKEILSTAFNHLYTEEELNGDLIHDKLLILKSIKNGSLYMAFDGLCDARGFLFSAEGDNLNDPVYPGYGIYLRNSITLKISVPEACTCKLIRDGVVIKEWQRCRRVPYTIYEPGYYRVECALSMKNNLYDWIYSNPIYVVRG